MAATPSQRSLATITSSNPFILFLTATEGSAGSGDLGDFHNLTQFMCENLIKGYLFLKQAAETLPSIQDLGYKIVR